MCTILFSFFVYCKRLQTASFVLINTNDNWQKSGLLVKFDFNCASILMTPYSFEPDSRLPQDSSRGMRGRAGIETLIKNFFASRVIISGNWLSVCFSFPN